MEKTIGQIQDEIEITKQKVKNILKDFYTENPSVLLSGNFGVSRTYKDLLFEGRLPVKKLVRSEIELKLNINIDEK